ncbi:DNA polymerase IV [bacterium]|nr:DNA polymerase IV [candidate division CSSED10-310 bacterium]
MNAAETCKTAEMEPRVLHVDMDAFYVAVELLQRPELRGKPVIVGARPPRGVVSTCSYEARKYGIHSGMASVQARQLCPGAVWLDGDFRSYSDYSRRFIEILRRYSPEVVQLSIDEARVNLTGCEQLFGPAQGIAHKILNTIYRELGLPASGGLANSGTAAKIAAELAKPAGLAVILPGNERTFLAPLKVERIPGVGQKSLPRFHRYGLYRIGDIAATPAGELQHILGRWAGRLQRVARGASGSVQRRRPESPSRSHERTFATDIREPERIRREIRGLVEKLGFRIRREGLSARTVSVKIRFGDFETWTRAESLDEPVNTDRLLFEVAMGLIERHLPEGRGVRLLGVSVQNLVSDCRQLKLFGAQDTRLSSFYKTVDGIRERFGSNAVQFGGPTGSGGTSWRWA